MFGRKHSATHLGKSHANIPCCISVFPQLFSKRAKIFARIRARKQGIYVEGGGDRGFAKSRSSGVGETWRACLNTFVPRVFKKGRKRGKRWLSFPHQNGTDRYYQCKSLTNVIDKYLWRFMNIRACRPRLARIKRVCSKLSLSLSLRLRALSVSAGRQLSVKCVQIVLFKLFSGNFQCN